MKTFRLTEKYKRYNSRHAKKSHKKNLQFKDYKKRTNRSKNLLSKTEKKRYTKHPPSHFEDHKHIKAPRNFSFIENTREVSDFIGELQGHFKSRNKVFIDLTGVETINYDAIVVLLAIMVKFKANKIPFNGNNPENNQARLILEKSGFFDHLYLKFKKENKYDLAGRNNNNIHTHAMKKVEPTLSSKLVNEASKKLWGEPRRCQGVQRVLLELMQNTNNHAQIGKEGEKHWWLSVHKIENENRVCFSFIDFGVGVFESLEKKNQESKFFGWRSKLSKAFRFESNSDILRLILDGELHQTVTGKPYRGKGIPGIRDALKRNQISKLHIITNDTSANVERGIYEKLNKSFSGTYIYWELNEKNRSCGEG